jgi:hypothetical protein
MRKKHRGQIVFTAEGSFDCLCWFGRLLNKENAMDASDKDRPVPVTWTPYFNISPDPEGGFKVSMNGGDTYRSRRYSWYPTLDKAQAAGIRWAARRFYYRED